MTLLKKIFPFVLLIFSLQCIDIWELMTSESFADIKKRGKLKVITAYNANSYFIYKDETLGYEYELLQLLAKDLGLELEIKVTKDLGNLDYMLNSGEGDLIAANILATREKEKQLRFTEDLMTTKLVIVQRSKGFSPNKKKTDFIADQVGLIGKQVHVREKSDYYKRLKKLQDEIGGTIKIQAISDNSIITDELIAKVYKGEIDYTVADEQTALINKAYYNELDVSIPITFPQKIAWVVKRNSPELLQEVNKWILKIKENKTLEKIQNKYYKNPRAEVQILKEEVVRKSRISSYDDLIRAEAKKLGWDWRLLAALIYQESRFNPNAKSWAGAMGLMQIMPSTAKTAGIRVDELMNPTKNIQAGVRHLVWLNSFWAKSLQGEERIKFVLASYNAGQGHVLDAIALTRSRGKSPRQWDKNVDESILLLSDPDYYNLPEIKYGYCRGIETYTYIREIFKKYEEYKKG